MKEPIESLIIYGGYKYEKDMRKDTYGCRKIMKYIETLREGERICEIYLCKSKMTALTKAGKPYESIALQDKTGVLDAKVWDVGSAGIDDYDAMDYIQVTGDVTSFQGNLQLNVKRIRVADEGEYEPQDYLPMTEKDIDEMYRELLTLVASIQNTYLKQLAESFFKNEEIAKAFRTHSAAKSVHHGFVGGLLEHTLAVAKICDFYAGMYAHLNRDLLLCAAMLHDIGKIKEISSFPENEYTDEGQLLGHIVMGAEMVGEHAREIAGFPNRLLNEVKHCILSHHGELEYGSPKKPALAEAVALNFADNADAKIETMKEALAGVESGNTTWQGFNRFLGSNIRRTGE